MAKNKAKLLKQPRGAVGLAAYAYLIRPLASTLGRDR
jgi:hypothetical protein